jgi:hypothetical protein
MLIIELIIELILRAPAAPSKSTIGLSERGGAGGTPPSNPVDPAPERAVAHRLPPPPRSARALPARARPARARPARARPARGAAPPSAPRPHTRWPGPARARPALNRSAPRSRTRPGPRSLARARWPALGPALGPVLAPSSHQLLAHIGDSCAEARASHRRVGSQRARVRGTGSMRLGIAGCRRAAVIAAIAALLWAGARLPASARPCSARWGVLHPAHAPPRARPRRSCRPGDDPPRRLARARPRTRSFLTSAPCSHRRLLRRGARKSQAGG